MGGKHKQAQRTKNNARPSSSGRSAELLGNTSPGFFCFTTLKDGGFAPIVPSDELDPIVNPDFRRILKKMNKKDGVTKLKALQEFAELCRNSEPAAVKAVLPLWPRLYTALALDRENRVREAAHSAQRAVASCVGRDLAPFLKQLAGPWFVAQYDTYPPAASAATLAFQEAFPPNKLIEAIVFCQEEILNYILDNLLNQTVQTLSNPKTTSTEDMEANHQRLLVSSLHGYALYLERLPTELLRSAEQANHRLVSAAKYWKLSKHESPAVRRAWFCSLIGLCQRAAWLLVGEGKHVGMAVFSSLDEPEPTVLPTVWQAALHVLVAVQDCWEHVSAEKLVFPKLWRILREGGQGNAATIFPNLLPLISKIPARLIADKTAFYTRFFDNMQQGMKQRSLQQSNSECEAVTSSYVECLRYLVMVHVDDLDFCLALLSQQVLPLVSCSLHDPYLKNCSHSLFLGLSEVTHQWHGQVSAATYRQLADSVWSALLRLCTEATQEAGDAIGYALDAQLELVACFMCPQRLPSKRKQLKVKFSDDTSPQSDVIELQAITEPVGNPMVSPELLSLWLGLIKMCHQQIAKKHDSRPLFITQLWRLVQLGDSHTALEHMCEEVGGRDLYQELLADWLNDPLVLMDTVLGLSFMYLQHTTGDDEAKRAFFHNLTQVRTASALVWCVRNYSSADGLVEEWLKSDYVVEALPGLVAADMSEESCDAVSQCLGLDPSGGPMVSEAAIDRMLVVLAKHIPQLTAYLPSLLSRELLGSEASHYLQGQEGGGALANLLSAVFKTSLEPRFAELEGACDAAIAVMVSVSAGGLAVVEQCTVCILHFIMRGGRDFAHLDYLVQRTFSLVKACVVRLPGVTETDIAERKAMALRLCSLFMSRTEEVLTSMEQMAAWACLDAEMICGHLGCEDLGGIGPVMLTDVVVTSPVRAALFRVSLLEAANDSNCRDSDEPFMQLLPSCDLIHFTGDLLAVVYLANTARLYCSHFPDTSQSFFAAPDLKLLQKRLKEMVQRLTEEAAQEMASAAEERALCKGGLWAPTLLALHTDLLETADLNTVYGRIELSPGAPGFFHVTQVFAREVDVKAHTLVSGNDISGDTLDTAKLCLTAAALACRQSPPDAVPSQLVKVVLDAWATSQLPLPKSKMANVSRGAVVCSVGARTVAEMINRVGDELPVAAWDTVLISTASLIDSFYYNNQLGTKMDVALLAAVCHLFDALSRYLTTGSQTSYRLRCEWRDVFAPDAHKQLAQIWVRQAGKLCEGEPSHTDMLLVGELSRVICGSLEYTLFASNDHEAMVGIHKSCTLLESSGANTTVQLAAHYVISRLLPLTTNNSDEEDKPVQKNGCEHFYNAIRELHTKLAPFIMHYRPGEMCSIDPFTDVYLYVRAYLLLWLNLLDLVALSEWKCRFQYTSWIKSENLLPCLMQFLMRLMPEHAVHCIDPTSKRAQELFSSPPPLTNSEWDSAKLAHLSCWVLSCVMLKMPGLARSWFMEAEHKVATIVDKVTTLFISPIVCAEEMKAIQQHQKQFENMTVRVLPSAREVVAVYTIEDSSTDLVIQLASNHPLGMVKVDSNKAMVSTSQTQLWLKQLKIFLTHQNGSMLDSLSLWKGVLDRKFEGVEECYICFSILHSASNQLPKLSCHTCRKKFHSYCLYKWFTTSNKSTCPICRNLF